MSIVAEHEIEARSAYLNHFLDLAAQGKRRGSSGGEKRARAIALAVCEHVPGIDGQAVAGLIEFIRLTASKPQTARQLLH